MENLIVKSIATEKTKVIEIPEGTILRNVRKIETNELQNPFVKPKYDIKR